ncbi:MAG: S41 family peptidase [Candidatus Doudnabacteria bacterium]|nr:S41 family peptidase [Candidatus Doudnabacteria bacterium]
MENQNTSASVTSSGRGQNKLFVGAVILIVLSYYLGFKQGVKGYVYDPKEFKIVNQSDTPKTVDYGLLWQAIDQVNKKYIEGAIDPQKTLYGAVSGAVGAVGDPYTEFFPPKAKEDFKTALAGSFDGIGAEIGKKDGLITIIAPLEDSPAKKAGILAKDIIVKVNGESTDGWSTEDTVSKIRGPKGTEVTLTIFREGRTQVFDVTIKRDKIEIKSVRWEIKEVGEQKKKIATITMSRFGDDTGPLFNKAVQEVLSQGAQGIILDLRNNPGGYLQTAVQLASLWVKEGDIVVTEARSQADSVKYTSTGPNKLAGIKTVVLINGGSASASEILSGALKDHNLARLIGEKSFGKGSVQELVDLQGGSAVKVTVAKWITPGGKNLNHDGLVPDIEVKLTEQDIKDGKDPQMEKAVEEISK